MRRLVGAGLAVLAVTACQRGGEGTEAPPGEVAPGTPLAERSRAGYEDQPMPGPETSVGRGIGPGAAPQGEPGATAGFEATLDQAEAAAATSVTEPVVVTGRITKTDEASVTLETARGQNLELLLPAPQLEYRSGMQVDQPDELRPGDEVRATYRISEGGEAVADEIQVTKPVKAK